MFNKPWKYADETWEGGKEQEEGEQEFKIKS